jgi:hypothetical protein
MDMPMKAVGGPRYHILKGKASVPGTYFRIRLALSQPVRIG